MTIIEDKYAAFGTAARDLGSPIGPERPTADGGVYQEYDRGFIFFHERVGRAHEVHGRIGSLYSDLGLNESELGYPTSDERDTAHSHPGHVSRVSSFEHGEIYWDAGRDAYEVFPPPDPKIGPEDQIGRWTIAEYNSGVVGIHAALMKNGKVLFFTYRDPERDAPGGNHASAPAEFGDWSLLDPSSGNVLRPDQEAQEMNLFCAGQALLADGRLLVGGGERETGRNVFGLNLFDPDTGSWSNLGELARGRWYPTCLTLPNGKVLITAGDMWVAPGTNYGGNDTYEIYNPAGELEPAQPAPFVVFEEPGFGGYTTYPFAFVVPGQRAVFHLGVTTHVLDLQTMEFQERAYPAAARPDRNGRTYGDEGTACLLPLDPDSAPPYRARIMMMGGGGARPNSIRTPATNTCEILDLDDPDPEWRLVAPMHYRRVMPDCVILPNEQILVMNGSSSGRADNGANPVFGTELYDPNTDTWEEAGTMSVPRLYHATALLLPDARVMTAGTDSLWNPDPFHASELRVEIFNPPYLYRGARPTMTEAPDGLNYEQSFSVRVSQQDTRFVLIRCGSSTHSFNSDQRLIKLRVVRRATVSTLGWRWYVVPIGNRPIKVPIWGLTEAYEVHLQSPPSGDVAPPGYYMLFAVNEDGVPSEAKTLQLAADRFDFSDHVENWFDRLITDIGLRWLLGRLGFGRSPKSWK